MSTEEIKASKDAETPVEKVGFFRRAWKSIVTGVVCAVVGGGIVAGADVAKIQDTITKAQARQIAMTIAQYSADQVLTKITAIATSETKAKAIKEAVEAAMNAYPDFEKAATTVKETTQDAAKDIKDGIDGAKKEISKEAPVVKATTTNDKKDIKEITLTAPTAKKTEKK